MNVIIDTNILYQDHRLMSTKSKALLDYLKKTDSKLYIPEVVRQEMIAKLRRTLTDLSKKHSSLTGEITRWSSKVRNNKDLNLDIDNEIADYEEYINELTSGQLVRILPYDDSYLDEVVKRLCERKKPASEKRKEFRDVIIWLSIKDTLRNFKKHPSNKKQKFVFISDNKAEFGCKETDALHPDLLTELSEEKLKLKYFCSVDDFIKQYKSKIDYIDSKWVMEALKAINLRQLVEKYILSIAPLGKWDLITTNSWIYGYPEEIKFKFKKLEDFYLYELENGDLFLHTSCLGEVSGELQTFEFTLDNEFTDKVLIEFEGRIHNHKLSSLDIVNLNFEGDIW